MINDTREKSRVTKRYSGEEQKKKVAEATANAKRQRRKRKLADQGMACASVIASTSDAHFLGVLKQFSIPVMLCPIPTYEPDPEPSDAELREFARSMIQRVMDMHS